MLTLTVLPALLLGVIALPVFQSMHFLTALQGRGDQCDTIDVLIAAADADGRVDPLTALVTALRICGGQDGHLCGPAALYVCYALLMAASVDARKEVSPALL